MIPFPMFISWVINRQTYHSAVVRKGLYFPSCTPAQPVEVQLWLTDLLFLHRHVQFFSAKLVEGDAKWI